MEARADANLINEALNIAYHKAVILLDSSGDSAHRAFGCLYGVERYGNPVVFVPRSVATASGIQKLLSAVFIFLFGLAVRNIAEGEVAIGAHERHTRTASDAIASGIYAEVAVLPPITLFQSISYPAACSS